MHTNANIALRVKHRGEMSPKSAQFWGSPQHRTLRYINMISSFSTSVHTRTVSGPAAQSRHHLYGWKILIFSKM